jgi:hypothetical protein
MATGRGEGLDVPAGQAEPGEGAGRRGRQQLRGPHPGVHVEEKEAGESSEAEKPSGFNKSFYRIFVNLLDGKFHRYACTKV